MANKKETVYWTSCILYGVILTGLLLYIRFPTEKFRRYCERIIENRVPETSCNIAEIQYKFPSKINFNGVQVRSKKKPEDLLFEDPLFSVQPVWKNPVNLFTLQSTAFGGSHKARVQVNWNKKSLELSDVVMKGIKLEDVYPFQQKLDRKVGGIFGLTGAAMVKTDVLQILEAEGIATVQGGEFELKKPILELSNLKLVTSSVRLKLEKDAILFTKGKAENEHLKASFDGNISFAEPWLFSSISINGGIIPLTPLLKEKKSLKLVVARMQKRYKTQSLPYKVDGTIGRPTFTFGN